MKFVSFHSQAFDFYVFTRNQEHLVEFRDWVDEHIPDATLSRCQDVDRWNTFGIDVPEDIDKVHFKMRWGNDLIPKEALKFSRLEKVTRP